MTEEQRAVIRDAISSITASADSLRACHTSFDNRDDWGDDHEAKADYDADIALIAKLGALLSAEQSAAANPYERALQDAIVHGTGMVKHVPYEQFAASTPAAQWREKGESDPHGDSYDCERAALTLGKYTDDEIANGVFMHGNEPLDLKRALARDPEYHSAIVWLTAAKDRIRWLSRTVVKAGADTARLDFMVRTGAVVQWYGETCQLHGSAGVLSGSGEFYESAREAVDAAMAMEQQ
jgi:hypothetical protein